MAATAMAGCTRDGDESGGPSPSPTERRYDKPANLPRFPISSSPTWGSKQAGLRMISDIIFARDAAVIAGSTKDYNTGQQMIKVVDAQTGKVRWSKELLKQITTSRPEVILKPDIAVVDDDGDGLVLVHYHSSECTSGMCAPGTVEHTDEQGIAALSLADGSLQWTHPVIPAVKSGSTKAEKLEDISLKLVPGLTTIGLVITGPTEGVIGNKYVDPDTMRSIALDPKTGEQSWSVKRAVAQRVVGKLVLATEHTVAQAGPQSATRGGPLALDTLTGKEVWNRSKDYADSLLASVSGGMVIVQTLEGSIVDSQNLLSLADGTTQLTLPAKAILIGDEGGDLFAAYSNPAGNLVTLASGERSPIEAAHPPTDVFKVAAVHDGYLLAAQGSVDPSRRITLAFDRSGNKLSDPIPGNLMKVNDTALVTRSRSGDGASGYDQFSVYPLKP